MSSDLVASWDVPCSDGVHSVQVEHGTISGKRVISVDGMEVIRRDWMFRLVGSESFELGRGRVPCRLKIEPLGAFAYQYSLHVDGKPFRKFTEQLSRVMHTWLVETPGGATYRVVLEKDTLDVWVNGVKQVTTAEFADEGTANHFALDEKGSRMACIRATSSGIRRQGLVYALTVNDKPVPEFHEGAR